MRSKFGLRPNGEPSLYPAAASEFDCRIGSPQISAIRNPQSLDPMFAIIRAEPNRLVLQIVRSPNESHRSALGPHQD